MIVKCLVVVFWFGAVVGGGGGPRPVKFSFVFAHSVEANNCPRIIFNFTLSSLKF